MTLSLIPILVAVVPSAISIWLILAAVIRNRERNPFMNLFQPSEMLRRASQHWFFTRDADLDALALFRRHYSFKEYRDGRARKHFVGPGEKLVLVTGDGAALFVWRKFLSGDGQTGVNCAVFRNESPARSSELILEAEEIAWERWPGERLFTYVNPRKIASRNPGFCFKCAGWRAVGVTKWNRLAILEKTPEAEFSGRTQNRKEGMT